jgi:hypothetical protein
MIVQVVAELNGLDRAVGWVSQQPDGSVSVGLSDRTFVAPNFRARNFVWNAYNRVPLEYAVSHDPQALEPVSNPHLTFHPPIYFHLRENGRDELWAGIADVAIMLEQEGRVPWVRFVSKPFKELKAPNAPRDPARTTIRRVRVPIEDCSIGLAIDFERRPGEPPPEWVTRNLVGATAGVGIDIHTCVLAPQISTLAWFHYH